MKKIILFLSLVCLVECHGMQRLARRTVQITRAGTRHCADKSTHQNGSNRLGNALRNGAFIGAGVGAVGGGAVMGYDALSNDDTFMFTPLFGCAGALMWGAAGWVYGRTWPVSVPLTIAAVAYSAYKEARK